MSAEDVEIVRRVYDAAARRDSPTIFSLYDPNVELDYTRLELPHHSGEAGGIYRGHDGLRSFFQEWHEAWEDLEYDYDELIDAGQHVISVVTRRARGRVSGAEVERPFALVWTLSQGKVVRVAWFNTRDEALEAAGVSA
jgi:ketosteroid isomerase-like protein